MNFLFVCVLVFGISTLSAYANYEGEVKEGLFTDNSLDYAATEADGDEDLELSEEEAEHAFQKDAKPRWRKLKTWGGMVIRSLKKFRIKNIIKKTGNSLEKIGQAILSAGNKVDNHLRRKSICYNPYGCFNNRSPWNLIWNVLPQPPRKVGTTFFLYNRRNRRGVRLNALAAYRSKHRFDKKTIFIVHGWQEGYREAAYIRQMKDKFLRLDDFNVFGVYWDKGAKTNYFQAAGNTRLVGAQIAYLVDQLNRYKGLILNKVHLIGFSLGAQTVGFAGRRLREKGKTIARITGLDPAGPIFARQPEIARLDKTDAEFVDVIHTSFLYLVGIKGQCGDIDFYVNGGGKQPGCRGSEAARCSHARAVRLFLLSIDGRCKYTSYKCSSYISFRLRLCRNCRRAKCTNLGFNVNKWAKGNYYLTTKSKSPYCCKYSIAFLPLNLCLVVKYLLGPV